MIMSDEKERERGRHDLKCQSENDLGRRDMLMKSKSQL